MMAYGQASRELFQKESLKCVYERPVPIPCMALYSRIMVCRFLLLSLILDAIRGVVTVSK